MLPIIHYYKEGKFFTSLPTEVHLVIGSNMRGRHGAGAALMAANHFGLKEGFAEGLCGQCYAIPTKDYYIKTLAPLKIAYAVLRFLKFARENPKLKFLITPIATGLAGMSETLIAPMFRDLPENCAVHEDWVLYIAHEKAIDIEL